MSKKDLPVRKLLEFAHWEDHYEKGLYHLDPRIPCALRDKISQVHYVMSFSTKDGTVIIRDHGSPTGVSVIPYEKMMLITAEEPDSPA